MHATSNPWPLFLIVLAAAAPGCVHWRASREYFGGTLGGTPESVTAVHGEWKVADASDLAPGMPGLLQSAQDAGGTPHLCFVENVPFEEGTIEVRLKAVAGAQQQGGGIVWRARDASNYYVCHFDPLASMLTIEKVAAGARVQLGSSKVELTAGWHQMHVEADGGELVGIVDGSERLVVEDETFQDAGRVGLWAPASAQTIFADFLVVTRD